MLRTTPTIAGKFARSRVSAGDIVVALRGPVGLPRIVPPDLEGANLTQGTARVAVNRDHSTDYVYWALQSPHTMLQYASHAKGSTFSEISLEALRKIEVPVRTLLDQRAIATRMRAIDSSVQSVAARRQQAQHACGALVNALLQNAR
jgi:type I restriction enzyme S subunit